MGYGSGIKFNFPNLTWQCSPKVEALVDSYPPESMIVDMGSGGRRIRPNVKTVDFVDTGNTDYVCDVCATPLDGSTVDLVIATGLLEHLESADKFMAEAYRILKPNGALHIEVPFLQQYHDDPIDCRRYTVPGLKLHLEQHGFTVEESNFHIGPSVTLATLNAYYASLIFEGHGVLSKVVSRLAFTLTALIWKPFIYLDKFLLKKKNAHRLAFGVYATAKKTPGSLSD